MFKRYSISNFKKISRMIHKTILPIILVGKAVEIYDSFEIDNRKFFSFKFSDDRDNLIISIIYSSESQTKIEFVLESFHSRKQILIKEPRNPRKFLSIKGIDLEISPEAPPIGTDIRFYKEEGSIKNHNNGTAISNLRKIQKTEKNNPNTLAFTSASELLQKETLKSPQSNDVPKFDSFDLFYTFLKNTGISHSNLIYFRKIGIQSINLGNIFFIITKTHDDSATFNSKITFYANINKDNESTKIIEFEIRIRDVYDLIKKNLRLFNSLDDLQKFSKLGVK